MTLLLLGCSEGGAELPTDDAGGSHHPRRDGGGIGEPDADAEDEDAGGVATHEDAAAPNARDAALPPITGPSPCTIRATVAQCASEALVTLDPSGADARRIYWARPPRAAPADGFPAVVLYQGSIYGPSLSWDVELPIDTPFGGYYQVVLIATLLEQGYTVVQPEASGGLAWNTNASANYDSTFDAQFIPALLDALAAGSFGSVDMDRLYATGISSGGYMTSRMAVSYPGRFRALAIQSASYATCLGPLCSVPSDLPDDHPPTLLLHGSLDTTVPIATARAYEARLIDNGIETDFIEDTNVGHAWLAVAPDAIAAWFDGH